MPVRDEKKKKANPRYSKPSTMAQQLLNIYPWAGAYPITKFCAQLHHDGKKKRGKVWIFT